MFYESIKQYWTNQDFEGSNIVLRTYQNNKCNSNDAKQTLSLEARWQEV